MAKFIQIGDTIINVEVIGKLKFISDDIFLGDFQPNNEGNPVIDYMPFTFAEILTRSGEKIELCIPLYYIEDAETEGQWYDKNRNLIKVYWTELMQAIEPKVIISMY